jgi:hypothetical protein
LGRAEELPIRLCFTAWNSPLVAYYEHAGFVQIYEDGEEAHFEVAPALAEAI